jgi:hypothetical protein
MSAPLSFQEETARMADLGFAFYGDDTFEHRDCLTVTRDGRYWRAWSSHIHDDEREEGVEGHTPLDALNKLLAEIDFEAFAEGVAATAKTMRELRTQLGAPAPA